ncbi:MAG: MarR family EPS-associated transcriptional regulator [Desulfobacterales bacterium]|nr:MarR family EPS-associated transcriptional regulator [Desulfobacterales bacterium]
MNTAYDKEIRLKLLKILEKEHDLTQREMNQKMGVSLGKVNYCLTELAKKGMIKIERFQKHPKKSAYLYRLTPTGIEEIAKLTIQFLKHRLHQYDEIKVEIENLSSEISKIDSELCSDPKLKEVLKKILT